MHLQTSTLVELFLHTVQRIPDNVALRRRDSDGWHAMTWRQYARITEVVAGGMLALGVQPGCRVGIWAHNCPEWLFADLGAMRAGAVTVPLYPTLISSQAEHVIAHSEMRVLVVQTNQQQQQVRAMRARCAHLMQVIVLQGESDGTDLAWEGFLRMGAAYLEQHPEAVARSQATLEPDSLASLIYTSGTTGNPKGAMLSHRNLLFEARQLLEMIDFRPREETLSFLPLSHVAERLQGEVMAIASGMIVNFGRGMEHLREDMVDVRPTVLVCVPRLWEKMREAMLAQLQQSSPRRQRLFGWALEVGRARFLAQVRQTPLSLMARAQAFLADRLVGAPIRRRLGLDRAHFVVSGAAPLAPEVQTFFASLGLFIQEAYGLTETSGIAFGTPSPQQIRPGSVGLKLPGTEVRLAADGEIYVRGEHVFLGYFRDPAATEAALINGWLHTGDVGELDADGYLRVTERKKDIIVTAGGKNVAPQNIENRLKAHFGVSQAVVLGDNRRFLVALVTVDAVVMERVLGRAPRHPVSRDSAVRSHLEGVVAQVNQELSSFETIKRFEILDEDFSIERGELTPTLKLKRRVIDERYRHVIDQLYAAA